MGAPGWVGAYAVGLSVLLALGSVAYAGAHAIGRGSDSRPTPTTQRYLLSAAAVAMAAAVPWAGSVFMFFVVVALNLTVGRRENFPFSTYPMFSEPFQRTAVLVVHTPDGRPHPALTAFGVSMVAVNKKFVSNVRGVQQGTLSEVEAGREIADYLVESARSHGCPPVADDLRVCLIELAVEGARVVRTERMLCSISTR